MLGKDAGFSSSHTHIFNKAQAFEHIYLKPEGQGTTWSHLSATGDRSCPWGGLVKSMESGGGDIWMETIWGREGGGSIWLLMSWAGTSAGHTIRGKACRNLALTALRGPSVCPVEAASQSWGRPQSPSQTSGGLDILWQQWIHEGEKMWNLLNNVLSYTVQYIQHINL